MNSNSFDNQHKTIQVTQFVTSDQVCSLINVWKIAVSIEMSPLLLCGWDTQTLTAVIKFISMWGY